jgi:hypothetical protein
MKIAGPFFFVLINATSEKELAGLGQASAFFLSYMQQSRFDFSGYPESDTFVLGHHDLRRILDPATHISKTLSA